MLSSSTEGEETRNNNKTLKLKGVLTSFSSPTTTKAMEEVWKDINLASLNDHNTRPMTTSSTLGGVIFQDFLTQPFSIDPSNNIGSKPSETGSLFCPASPAPPPVTALSLSCSRPDFHFDPLRPKGSQLMQSRHHHASKVACFTTTPVDSLACTSSLPNLGSKRFAEPSDTNPGDRRNKRMIKNRESAARSRARKQAYTNELQLKVDNLLKENARLKRQQLQLREAAANQQKKKCNLYRASTAPF